MNDLGGVEWKTPAYAAELSSRRGGGFALSVKGNGLNSKLYETKSDV